MCRAAMNLGCAFLLLVGLAEPTWLQEVGPSRVRIGVDRVVCTLSAVPPRGEVELSLTPWERAAGLDTPVRRVKSFELRDDALGELWRRKDGWYLCGLTLATREPKDGVWELTCREPRVHDRLIARVEVPARDVETSVVVAFRFRWERPSESFGCLAVYLLEGSVLAEWVRVQLPMWAAPQTPDALSPGWSPAGGETNVSKPYPSGQGVVVQEWSWNGPMSGWIAKQKYEKLHGASPVFGAALGPRRAELLESDFEAWPDSVWVLCVKFVSS